MNMFGKLIVEWMGKNMISGNTDEAIEFFRVKSVVGELGMSTYIWMVSLLVIENFGKANVSSIIILVIKLMEK